MINWYQHYVNRMNDKYREYMKSKYALFLYELKNHMLETDIILEIGCGAGNITRLLLESFKVERSYLIDNDSQMLKLTYENLKHIQNPWFTYRHDIVTNVGTYNVKNYKPNIVFSHGVLEHFSDEEINKIIKNFDVPIQLHYVPGNKYVTPSMGNERLMTPKQWFDICNPTDILEFNGGYDYILVFERQND